MTRSQLNVNCFWYFLVFCKLLLLELVSFWKMDIEFEILVIKINSIDWEEEEEEEFYISIIF